MDRLPFQPESSRHQTAGQTLRAGRHQSACHQWLSGNDPWRGSQPGEHTHPAASSAPWRLPGGLPVWADPPLPPCNSTWGLDSRVPKGELGGWGGDSREKRRERGGVSYHHQMCLYRRRWADLVSSPGLRCCWLHSATLNAASWSWWMPPAGSPSWLPGLCKVQCAGRTLWHKSCGKDCRLQLQQERGDHVLRPFHMQQKSQEIR